MMPIKYIRKTLKSVVKKAYKYNALIKLNQIRSIKNPTVNTLTNVIYDILKDNLDREEKKWVALIEEKRRILYNNPEKISVIDYGAGSPYNVFTDDIMHKEIIKNSTIGDISRKSSKSYFWSLLLFKLIREFKPLNCIELGTCMGISGAYQAAALKMNKQGKLITLEGSESLASIAKTNFQQFGLDTAHIICGRFIDKLDDVLNTNKPIDYAFIDGHHDEHATLLYFEKFIPYLSKNSVLIFDDISWSDGMRRAWGKIKKNEAVKISVYMRAMGVIIIDENIKEKYSFKIPIV